VPLVARLYLPKAWTTDNKRLDEVGVPLGAREFLEKRKIALIVFDEVWGDIPFEAVTFDAAYGSNREHIIRRCDEILETADKGGVRFPRAIKALMQRALAIRDETAALPAPERSARRYSAAESLEAELERLVTPMKMNAQLAWQALARAGPYRARPRPGRRPPKQRTRPDGRHTPSHCLGRCRSTCGSRPVCACPLLRRCFAAAPSLPV
jgi:hypothetical protein